MKKSYLLQIVLVACLTGCSLSDAVKSDDGKSLGSDRDIHGCIGSAGYSWCGRSNQCERPWELAEKEVISIKKELVEGAGLTCSCQAKENGLWLTAIPHRLNGTELAWE